MAAIDEVKQWVGAEVRDPAGDRVGRLDHVYEDSATGRPTYGAVATKRGLFRASRRPGPLDGAHRDLEAVNVEGSRDAIGKAPSVEADGWLSHADETRLDRHHFDTAVQSEKRSSTAAPPVLAPQKARTTSGRRPPAWQPRPTTA